MSQPIEQGKQISPVLTHRGSGSAEHEPKGTYPRKVSSIVARAVVLIFDTLGNVAFGRRVELLLDGAFGGDIVRPPPPGE
jgi:hypothetical protein